MPPPFDIPLCRPPVGDAEIEAATRVLRSGHLVMGDAVLALEAALARESHRKHAVAVSSGTAALSLALAAAGVGPGDEVVVPDFTFPATASTVRLAGAKPVVVDVRPTTWNIDPGAVSRAASARTKVVMPVDQLGLPADSAAAASGAPGSTLVVDAACSLGARDAEGRPAGSQGRMACVSLHPRKTITSAEGGAVLCDDDTLAARLRRLRNHGMEEGDFHEPGWNLRLSDVHAAVALPQIGRLAELVEARRGIASRYLDRLEPLATRGRVVFQQAEGALHPYQTFAVRVVPSRASGGEHGGSTSARDALRAAMAGRGIELGLAGWALHRTTAYRAPATSFPVADALFAEGVALPCFPGLTGAQIDRVCGSLAEILAEL